MLFIPHNTKTICLAYRSEHNNKRKKQIILLMITDGKKWHYVAVTNLPALLKEHEEISNNHDSCQIEIPKWVEIHYAIYKIQSKRKIIKSAICNLS